MVTVDDLQSLTRSESGYFMTEDAVVPAENANVFHGYIEQSNVDPVVEITRMIEVQRAYEMGQTFLNNEDERIRQFIRIAGNNA